MSRRKLGKLVFLALPEAVNSPDHIYAPDNQYAHTKAHMHAPPLIHDRNTNSFRDARFGP